MSAQLESVRFLRSSRCLLVDLTPEVFTLTQGGALGFLSTSAFQSLSASSSSFS